MALRAEEKIGVRPSRALVIFGKKLKNLLTTSGNSRFYSSKLRHYPDFQISCRKPYAKLTSKTQQRQSNGEFGGNICNKKDGESVVHINRVIWPKNVIDKFSNFNILLLDLKTLVQNCSECFQTRTTRSLDWHKFLSREQKPIETLHQFWNVLNGLAARCDFGNQTKALVNEMFALNMINTQVQKRLCIEPRETQEPRIKTTGLFGE